MRNYDLIFYFDRADRILRFIKRLSKSIGYKILCAASRVSPRHCPRKEPFFKTATIFYFFYTLPERVPLNYVIMGTAFAVMNTLYLYGIHSRYLWPWHLLVNDKKISRIDVPAFSERSITARIFINLNNSFKSTPYSSRVTSMRDILERSVSESEFGIRLLGNLEKLYEFYLKEPQILIDFFSRYSDLIKRRIIVETASGILNGTCEGLDKEGRLALSTDRGVIFLNCTDVIRVEV